MVRTSRKDVSHQVSLSSRGPKAPVKFLNLVQTEKLVLSSNTRWRFRRGRLRRSRCRGRGIAGLAVGRSRQRNLLDRGIRSSRRIRRRLLPLCLIVSPRGQANFPTAAHGPVHEHQPLGDLPRAWASWSCWVTRFCSITAYRLKSTAPFLILEYDDLYGPIRRHHALFQEFRSPLRSQEGDHPVFHLAVRFQHALLVGDEQLLESAS